MQTKIIELIAQAKGIPELVGTLNNSSHLIDDAGLDSLQLINLVLLVESEFNIEVDFDSFRVEHLSSVDRFTEFVAALVKK